MAGYKLISSFFFSLQIQKVGSVCVNDAKCSGDGGFAPFSGYTLEQCQDYCFDDASCYFYSFCPGTGFCQGFPAYAPPVNGSGCASVCDLGGCGVYSTEYNISVVTCQTDGVGLYESGACGTSAPTSLPTAMPSAAPSLLFTNLPTSVPTKIPSTLPTPAPSHLPTNAPTVVGQTYPPTPSPTTVSKLTWQVCGRLTIKVEAGASSIVLGQSYD